MALTVLFSLPAAAISSQQIEEKARELADFKKKQELLSIAKEIGADIENVRVKFELNGQNVKLTGYVPNSNDLIRILLAAKAVGPFQDIRNYIKIETPTVADGVIMRPVYYEFVSPPAGTELSDEDKESIQLSEEYKQLNEKITKLVLRKHDTRSYVYNPSAQKLVERLIEIQFALDGSSCFKRVEPRADDSALKEAVSEIPHKQK